MQDTIAIKENDARPRLWAKDTREIIGYMALESGLTIHQKNILEAAWVLACQSNSYTCTASIQTIVDFTGISRSTVKRTFHELEHRGLLYNVIRPGNGKNETTARVFVDDFVALIARVNEEAKRLKMKAHKLAQYARKLYKEFVEKPVDNCPAWGSTCPPCEEENGVHGEPSNPADGVHGEPQITAVKPTDQKPKKIKDKKTLFRPISIEFLNKIKNIDEFLREGIESRKRDIANYFAEKALKNGNRASGRQPKEDPMFRASYADVIYTKPADFR